MPPAREPTGADRLSTALTINVGRLAAERGLSVEEVARQAGLKPDALSPAGMGRLRIVALAEVAKVLGVEPCRLFPE